jgi:regulator of replication initiation timing
MTTLAADELIKENERLKEENRKLRRRLADELVRDEFRLSKKLATILLELYNETKPIPAEELAFRTSTESAKSVMVQMHHIREALGGHWTVERTYKGYLLCDSSRYKVKQVLEKAYG